MTLTSLVIAVMIFCVKSQNSGDEEGVLIPVPKAHPFHPTLHANEIELPLGPLPIGHKLSTPISAKDVDFHSNVMKIRHFDSALGPEAHLPIGASRDLVGVDHKDVQYSPLPVAHKISSVVAKDETEFGQIPVAHKMNFATRSRANDFPFQEEKPQLIGPRGLTQEDSNRITGSTGRLHAGFFAEEGRMRPLVVEDEHPLHPCDPVFINGVVTFPCEDIPVAILPPKPVPSSQEQTTTESLSPHDLRRFGQTTAAAAAAAIAAAAAAGGSSPVQTEVRQEAEAGHSSVDANAISSSSSRLHAGMFAEEGRMRPLVVEDEHPLHPCDPFVGPDGVVVHCGHHIQGQGEGESLSTSTSNHDHPIGFAASRLHAGAFAERGRMRPLEGEKESESDRKLVMRQKEDSANLESQSRLRGVEPRDMPPCDPFVFNGVVMGCDRRRLDSSNANTAVASAHAGAISSQPTIVGAHLNNADAVRAYLRGYKPLAKRNAIPSRALDSEPDGTPLSMSTMMLNMRTGHFGELFLKASDSLRQVAANIAAMLY